MKQKRTLENIFVKRSNMIFLFFGKINQNTENETKQKSNRYLARQTLKEFLSNKRLLKNQNGQSTLDDKSGGGNTIE